MNEWIQEIAAQRAETHKQEAAKRRADEEAKARDQRIFDAGAPAVWKAFGDEVEKAIHTFNEAVGADAAFLLERSANSLSIGQKAGGNRVTAHFDPVARRFWIASGWTSRCTVPGLVMRVLEREDRVALWHDYGEPANQYHPGHQLDAAAAARALLTPMFKVA